MCNFRKISIVVALLTLLLASYVCAATQFEIPYLKGIKVDGKASDWGNSGFKIDLFADSTGKVAASLNAKDIVRLGWNEKGLLALFQVADSTPHESVDSNVLWQGTGVELLMADRAGGSNAFHMLISPGISPEHSKIRSFFYDNRTDLMLKAVPLKLISERSYTSSGYTLEVLLPWSNLGIKPAIGARCAMQVMINHLDAAGKNNTLMWYPMVGSDSDTARMSSVVLSKETGRDKRFVAFSDGASVWPEKIAVVGDASLAGRKVTAIYDSKMVAQAVMQPSSVRSIANLSLSAEQCPQADKLLYIMVDGEDYIQIPPIESIVPIEPSTLAGSFGKSDSMLDKSPLVFSPFVFSGNEFPDCDFENASQIRSLFGGYTITRRFFNSNYEEVTRADKTGRYGAIVSVKTPGNGPSTVRYITLYRQKDTVDWNREELTGSLNLPEEMGIDPAACSAQNRFFNDLIKRALFDRISTKPDGAVVMAGISETPADSGKCTYRNSVWTLDNNWWYGLLKKLNKDVAYHYSAYLPASYDADTNKSWPLLIVLHGSGARELSDENLQRDRVFVPILESTKDKYPMITVIPHCPKWQHWDGMIIKDMIDSVGQKYRIDRTKIYLTGFSMGGYGSFDSAAQYPDLFTAVAPICGGGDPEDAAAYGKLPIWAFHGDKDPVVPVSESIKMVDAIKKAGGDAKLTIYPGAGHNAWDATFTNPAFYEWLLAQSK